VNRKEFLSRKTENIVNEMKIKRVSLWCISISLLVLAVSIFVIYKPILTISLNSFIVGMITGTISYYIGVALRAKMKKQFVFRFALITLIFNNNLFGIFIASLIWSLFHIISETLSELSIRYYRTGLGFLDNFISGMIFSIVYLFTGLNVFTPWIAHAFHNFLIWRDIAS
jgi:hypothetical protein